MIRNRKSSLLLLLIIMILVLTACKSPDPYQELNELWNLALPEPTAVVINGGEDTISTISLSNSFEVQLMYRSTDFDAISSLDKWTPLSEQQLNELSTLLTGFYGVNTLNASPNKRLTILNDYMQTDIKKIDSWFYKKDVVVKGDQLIILLEEDNHEIHAYYLIP